MKNYYDSLGVSQNATKKEISDAYRKLVLKYHPDRIKEEKLRKEAETKMLEINEAFEVLGSEPKRKEYDAHLRYGTPFGGNDGGYYSDYGEDRGSFFQQFNFGFGDFNNIFKQFFEMETEDFTGASSSSAPRRKVEIVLTMDEWYSGCVKPLKYSRQVECLKCNKTEAKCTVCRGSGYVPSLFSKVKCSSCFGKGTVKQRLSCNFCSAGAKTETASLKITIPPFINSSMTLSGHGDFQNSTGSYGNLEVKFSIEEHDLYKFDGNNIVAEVDLSLENFMYGTVIDMTYLDGRNININIDPFHTANIVVKGKGIHMSGRRGDLIVVLKYNKSYTNKLSKEEFNRIFNTASPSVSKYYKVRSK